MRPDKTWTERRIRFKEKTEKPTSGGDWVFEVGREIDADVSPCGRYAYQDYG